jgi:hypothetical protein
MKLQVLWVVEDNLLQEEREEVGKGEGKRGELYEEDLMNGLAFKHVVLVRYVTVTKYFVFLLDL